MRAKLGALLTLLAIGVSAPLAAQPRELSETEQARVRAVAEQYRARMHWTRESVDIDAVVAAVAARARSAEGPLDLGQWLKEEMARNWASWIPLEAAPQYEVQYAYPLDVRVPRLVLSAVEKGPIEFLTRVGTRVYAAREGSVARVIDGFAKCCLPENEGFRTNHVTVVHADGTVATYSRLRSGIAVREGQKLAVGDLIGYSGFVGATQVPGLVFGVWMWEDNRTVGLPVRFLAESADGALVETGQSIEQRPPRQLKLDLMVDGERLRKRGVVRKASFGDLVRLRLLEVRPENALVDVSHRADTQFDTSTPWLVEVVHGVVKFRKADWPGVPEGNVAKVRALYRDPDSDEVGYVDARFELSDGGGASR